MEYYVAMELARISIRVLSRLERSSRVRPAAVRSAGQAVYHAAQIQEIIAVRDGPEQSEGAR